MPSLFISNYLSFASESLLFFPLQILPSCFKSCSFSPWLSHPSIPLVSQDLIHVIMMDNHANCAESQNKWRSQKHPFILQLRIQRSKKVSWTHLRLWGRFVLRFFFFFNSIQEEDKTWFCSMNRSLLSNYDGQQCTRCWGSRNKGHRSQLSRNSESNVGSKHAYLHTKG